VEVAFAAVADIHLGAGSDYGPNPGDRLRDQERIWLDVCDEVANRRLPLIVAGDVFHRPRPSMAELAIYRMGIEMLRDAQCPVLVIAGNHDVGGMADPTGMDVLDGDGVIAMRDAGLIMLGDVEVACLPWAPLSGFMAARGGGDRDAARDEFARLLVDVAGGMRAQCTTPNPVLALHWSVTGASTVTGVPTSAFREVVIPVDEIAAQGWRYVVAGHIHKPQVIIEQSGGTGFYTGSLTTVDFGEADVPHGFFVVDPEPVFTQIRDRRFVTLEIPAGPLDALDFSDVADTVVRARFRQDSGLDPAEVRQRLLSAGCWKVYSVVAEHDRVDRVRVEAATETMGVDEALGMWITAREIDAATATWMREKTATYLEGGVDGA
jgi:DNA repair exonuclease SbcCD nuclease subunit